MTVFDVIEGDSPVILAQPHGGTHIPADIFSRLNACGKGLDDTDWHIDRLYAGLLKDATIVHSNIHRYVIDANRDPSGVTLYPGQNTTTLCPTTNFDGHPIWKHGQAPTEDEIQERRAIYHAPYHAALSEQIDRVKAKHGVAVLYDCHSIRSDIPFLFKGRLPVFNIGTDNGRTCHEALEGAVKDICMGARTYETVINGRFRGGWTTRHYGQPEVNIHAIQMELALRAYANESAPWSYHPTRAGKLRPILASILETLDQIARSGALYL